MLNRRRRWYHGPLCPATRRAVAPASLPPTSSDSNPRGIAPFLDYPLVACFYVGNGDMVARYDWDTKQVYLPNGIRIGKIFVKKKGSWLPNSPCSAGR